MVGALLEEADGGAIALGGGSVLSERVRAALARHIVVWLRSTPRRPGAGSPTRDRPLASSAEDVGRLLAERLPLYEGLADAVIPAARPRAGRPRPAVDPGPGRAAGRNQAALGLEQLRRVPGLRRPRPARRRLVAARGPPLLRRRLGDRRLRSTRPARLLPRRRPARSPGRRRRRWPRRSACCASWRRRA